MILSDSAIRRALETGEIAVQPDPSPSDIRGFGLRVHLDADLLIPVPASAEIDIAVPEGNHYTRHRMDETGYLLGSHDFVLACTQERVRTSRTIGCSLDGRSSVARLGIFVHSASTIIDNIHEGSRAIVLELYNSSARAVRLRSGFPMAMLLFFRLEGAIVQCASSQYEDQCNVIAPTAGIGERCPRRSGQTSERT